ncbi:MAG: Rpn family recombination-promoting nuclease/putative transposase [Fibrobacter sp.]|nr:Rpn family recombination-promoting nuclease/putative transposase [Fibrobacter sp.]
MKERKSLEDYLVKPGERSPFANLLVDLAFKKAFDPDKPTSRENLVNLLNDLLAPQLKRPIKNVWTRNVAKNLSGSKASRTAIFDLHCEDDAGELIEIEVQIRKLDNFLNRLAFYASEMVANQAEPGDDWDYGIKPTYVIAIARHRMFEDDRIVHRATVTDLETHEKFMDSYNFTVVELAKVPFFIESKSDSLSKWLFFFRYLNKLKALPPEMNEKKFRQLTESSKVSKFSREEFEAYQKVFHEKWDHNVLRRSFFEEFADDVNAKMDERSREIAKRLIANGKLSDEDIAKCSGLSIEDVVVLRSQVET